MNTSNNTVIFFDFIKEHNIQIPVIQRDYVQGRALNDKEKEKRNDFVKKLMDALLPEGIPCHLDFVYGGRECFGNQRILNKSVPFLPLDGQQRLTTLFLLHWILLQKNGIKEETNEQEQHTFHQRMNELAKFSYKTRISSERFCQKLTTLQTTAERSLIEQIKEKYWYDHDMQSDPTVKAMMQILSFMEEKMDSAPYSSYKKTMLENLFDTSKQRITFDVLDMEQYNLTDGLYVKMNARGKELTHFENWKASFTDMLEHSFKENNVNEKKERFCFSIEHEWNDVFWKIAYKNYKDKIDKNTENKPIEWPKIDDAFMHFFNNITRLLFFIIPKNQTLNAEDYKTGLWSTVNDVYQRNNEFCDILFDILDTLYQIDTENGSINKFFNDIFTTETNGNKVCLFDDKTDIFETACNSDTFSANHILLFAILNYCRKFQKFKADKQLLTYVRICRNYLFEHNYFDTANISISPQIRVTEIAQYLRFFEALLVNIDPLVSLDMLTLKDEYALREKSKLAYYQNPNVQKLAWKLEDQTLTYGNLSAFVSVLDMCMTDDSLCAKVFEAVEAFINAPALTKVQLFITFGYKGIEVRNCAYGKAIFLGSKFKGTPRWMVHFRKKYNSSSPINNWMMRYVGAFIQENNLNTILTQHMPTDKNSVTYYMLKYPDILASRVYWIEEPNLAPFYFAMMNPWNNLDMITIHSFSSRPLNNAYQVCPIANAVIHRINKFKKYYDTNRIGYFGQYADKQGIVINEYPNGWDKTIFTLTFGSWEWRLSQETYNRLPPSLQQKLRQYDNNNYVLCQTENKDLIEIAVDFINEVIIMFEQTKLLS